MKAATTGARRLRTTNSFGHHRNSPDAPGMSGFPIVMAGLSPDQRVCSSLHHSYG